MDNAEAAGVIAPEQYGSRKKHQVISQAINKRLAYDIIQQLKVPAILCSNDAKSCYDRVVHHIIMMLLCRLGVPKNAIKCMLDTYQMMKHHLRTAYGDTDKYFSCEDNDIKIHGINQGSGFAPTTWAAISTVILEKVACERIC